MVESKLLQVIKEKGIDRKTGKVVIEIDPVYFRPLEVDVLIGDSTKAQKTLGWRPKVTFQKLAQLMIAHDYDMVKKEAASGKRFEVHNPPSNNG